MQPRSGKEPETRAGWRIYPSVCFDEIGNPGPLSHQRVVYRLYLQSKHRRPDAPLAPSVAQFPTQFLFEVTNFIRHLDIR